MTGSYALVGEDIRLDLKPAISVERGTIDFASSAAGKPGEIINLERTLVEGLSKVIRVDDKTAGRLNRPLGAGA